MEEDCRIGEVLVEQDRCALDGPQRVAVLYDAGYEQRVNAGPCGEDISVARKHIAFVVVGKGVGEVESVGGVGIQRLLELHDQELVLDPGLRRLCLGRGQENVFRVLDGHVLVEAEHQLGIHGHVDASRQGIDADDERRYGVFEASGRSLRGVGAGMNEDHRQENGRRDYYWYELLEPCHKSLISTLCMPSIRLSAFSISFVSPGRLMP